MKSPARKPKKPAAKPKVKQAARPTAAGRGAPRSAPRTDPDLVALLDKLDHPLKPALLDLRKLILASGLQVREGVKWNSPSFRTSEYFATINLHDKHSLRLILHAGAKSKADAAFKSRVPDPAGLLRWLGKDRVLLSFRDAAEVKARKSALQSILRAWIAAL